MCSVTKSCPTLCDPMDWSPPAPLSMGFPRQRTLEWVAMLSSRRSSQPWDQTCMSNVSFMAGRFFTTAPPGKLAIYIDLQ